VTLRTLLSSTVGVVSWLLIRTMSPERMSGVTPFQQYPPGWLISMIPRPPP
jgi:hypothetical protein